MRHPRRGAHDYSSFDIFGKLGDNLVHICFFARSHAAPARDARSTRPAREARAWMALTELEEQRNAKLAQLEERKRLEEQKARLAKEKAAKRAAERQAESMLSAMKGMDEAELASKLRPLFDKLDKNQSGTIDMDELRMITQALKMNVDEGQLKKMMREADTSGDGQIEFDVSGRMETAHAPPSPMPATPSAMWLMGARADLVRASACGSRFDQRSTCTALLTCPWFVVASESHIAGIRERD